MSDRNDMGNITDTGNGGFETTPGGFARKPHSPRVILDIEGLMNRVEQDRDMARQIADVFLQDVPNQLQAVQRAFDDGSLDGLQRAAHSLRGASACAGANLVRDHAQQIEAAAQNADLDQIPVVLALLQSQIAAYRDLLEQTLPKSNSAVP